MSYFKLQFKRILKNKFTWFSLIAILLVCFYFWKQNYHLRNRESTIVLQSKSNLNIQKRNIKFYQNELKKPTLNTKDKKQIKHNLRELQLAAQELQTLIKAVQTNHWQTAYPILIKQNKAIIANAKRSNVASGDLAALERNLNRYEILAKNNLPEEEEHYSVKGGFFVMEMMQEVLPPLTVLAVIFILTMLYAGEYQDRQRLANLLPHQTLTSNMMAGAVSGYGYFLIAFLLILLVPSLFFGTGAFNYPMMGINPATGKYIFIPLIRLFLPILFLELLNFIFIAAAVLMIVQVFKNKLLALFVAAFSLVGGMVLPQYVEGFRNYAQFFPTSYFFPLQPVDGMFGISNAYVFADESKLVTYPKVTLISGIVVLVLWTVAIIVLNYLLARKSQNGRKTK